MISRYTYFRCPICGDVNSIRSRSCSSCGAQNILISVGREKCEIVVNNDYVAIHHLDIIYTYSLSASFYTLVSYGYNGTYIDNKILRKGEAFTIPDKDLLPIVLISGCEYLDWQLIKRLIDRETCNCCIKPCYKIREDVCTSKQKVGGMSLILKVLTAPVSIVASGVNSVVNAIKERKGWGKQPGISYRPLKVFDKNSVYSSIFAPAEVKRKSHLQVQVYLHLSEEDEKVKSLAKESDKNAERRDYIPLSLKLKKGDKVDVEFNIYGETRLASERKSIIWQGSFAKCTFDYFVPKDIDVEELSCEANLFVNGAMIGEMRFLTQIVEVPRNLNPEILSHRFNRIFISYAHQDAQQIKLLALAYKAQGVDYFYDRDSLAPGDVYEEKIFDYIDSSDLFVLCWSKNAAASDYVAKEKGRALLRAYPQLSQRDATLKICPISIEPRADLPSDMKEVYNFEVI